MELVEAQQPTSIAVNAVSSRENAVHHLNISVLHLMQSRLLLLRLVHAQQGCLPLLELTAKLQQLRRQADLLSDLIESAIPSDHISKWIGPALEELRVATAGGTQ